MEAVVFALTQAARKARVVTGWGRAGTALELPELAPGGEAQKLGGHDTSRVLGVRKSQFLPLKGENFHFSNQEY